MKCANVHPCILFLPRIDLWAMETQYLSHEEQSDSPSSRCTEGGDFREISETKDAAKTASYLWSSFMEQVESISVCTSLMILVCILFLAADLSPKAAGGNKAKSLKTYALRFCGKIHGFCRSSLHSSYYY